MASSTFDDYARTTFSVATNVADDTTISSQQMDDVIDCLTSAGSGPGRAASAAE